MYNQQIMGSLSAAPDAESVVELQKALTGGYETSQAVPVPGDAFPIRTESLEDTLKVTTYKAKDIKLWPMLPKLPTYSAVDQHAEIKSYSQNPEGGFFQEGGAPAPSDATYVRRVDQVKFIGVMRGVTHQMSLQRTLTSEPIALETVAGTMELLRKLEMSALISDSSLSRLQTDGFATQIQNKANAENIIDLRGAPIDEDILIQASTIVRSGPNFGQLTDFMFGTRNRSDIQRSFIPRERTDAFVQTADGIISKTVNGIDVDGGVVRLHGNPFIDDGGLMPTSAVGDASKIPLAPVISTALSTPTAANSQFISTDAGNFQLWAIACNTAGKSAPVSLGAATAIAAGEVFSFGLTPAPGSQIVEWYEIYRTPKNGTVGSQRRTIRQGNTDPATGIPRTGEMTLVDSNANIPGTSYGFGFMMDAEAMAVKLLAPMLRIPLPIMGTTIPWLQVAYLCYKLYAPSRNCYFKNIGALPKQAYNNG
jgi:hypothetical protein